MVLVEKTAVKKELPIKWPLYFQEIFQTDKK